MGPRDPVRIDAWKASRPCDHGSPVQAQDFSGPDPIGVAADGLPVEVEERGPAAGDVRRRHDAAEGVAGPNHPRSTVFSALAFLRCLVRSTCTLATGATGRPRLQATSPSEVVGDVDLLVLVGKVGAGRVCEAPIGPPGRLVELQSP
jgi:hypothetical protein